MRKHDYEVRDDGLDSCTVCGGGEGALPAECPGARMTADEQDAVYAGQLEYVHGRWWAPKTEVDGYKQELATYMARTEALARENDQLREEAERQRAWQKLYAAEAVSQEKIIEVLRLRAEAAERAKHGTPCRCESWITTCGQAEAERDAWQTVAHDLAREAGASLEVVIKEFETALHDQETNS
jgi:hypothetical protein